SGLLTTRLLTPILLATQGAVMAGRIGFALSVVIFVAKITAAWPTSQARLYTALYAPGRRAVLIGLFWRTGSRSTILSIALCLGLTCLLLAAQAQSDHIADRLPEWPVTAILMASTAGTHIAYCFAIFLRAQRTDPVLVPSMLLSIPAVLAYWTAAH